MSDEVAHSFRNGIVAPDQWKDYPHHHGKSENIKEHLMKSRGYFLQDDLPKSFFHLGVALHYIQDSYTSVVSYNSPNRQIWHQNWEQDIETSNIVGDQDFEKMINYSLMKNNFQRERCLRIAHSLSRGTEGRDNTINVATLSGHGESISNAKPIVDLNLGFRASLVVIESVLSSKNCPALENELRKGLFYHEALLRTAEVELANKIIGLVNERIDLELRRVPSSGIVSKIRNWILGMKIGSKERAVNFNYDYYTAKGHLHEVVREYLNAANRTVTPYAGWFNFQIPRINPNIVSKELLSVQDVAKALGEDEHDLKGSLHKHNVSIYYVRNSELVRRAELDRFLNQSPVFTVSPNIPVSFEEYMKGK